MQVGPQLFFWELQLFCCYLAVAASLLLPRLDAAALLLEESLPLLVFALFKLATSKYPRSSLFKLHGFRPQIG